MRRVGPLAIVLAALASAASADDDPAALPESELRTLAERALAAAVGSSGKTTLALDEGAIECEGPSAPSAEAVLAALRVSAPAAGARLVKHSESLEAPMIHGRFATLVHDHDLYLE